MKNYEMKVTVTVDGEDALGNVSGENGNVRTSVAVEGADSFITLTFGGRDGSSADSITIEQLLHIARKLAHEE